MTEERLALSELLEKAGDGDFLRAVADAVLQLLMEADVEGLIGAGRYERNGERTTWRNGHRDPATMPAANSSSVSFVPPCCPEPSPPPPRLPLGCQPHCVLGDQPGTRLVRF